MLADKKNSAFTPFQYQAFTILWLAALFSNIGTWMHSVGASWLMATLSASPFMVSLVQTATTLPVFFFALPAGALADIFHRRTILLIVNTYMGVTAMLFALLVWQDYINPSLLLILTLLMGAGTAFMAPAWQAVMPALVPKENLPEAVGLSGISINVSRAIGPALAGIMITGHNMASPFFANALSYVVIISALLWCKKYLPYTPKKTPPERVWHAMKAGVRYAFHSTPLKATMLHALGFMFCANSFWGMLPIITKEVLHGDASFFGMLMAAVGLGAVMGALVMPKLNTRLHANHLTLFGTLCTASVCAYYSVPHFKWLMIFASFVFGIGWIFVISSVTVSAQQALPDWVRARGLAIFLMILFGGMSLGAAFWGWLAGVTSIQITMLASALSSIVFIACIYRVKLQQGAMLDLTPSEHWPVPVVHENVRYDKGPVMITVAYQVAPQHRHEFIKAIYELKNVRLRSGAHHWGLFEDTEKQGHFTEYFLEDSWAAHIHHHERVSNADLPLQAKVNALHEGADAPKVFHNVAVYPEKKKKEKKKKQDRK